MRGFPALTRLVFCIAAAVAAAALADPIVEALSNAGAFGPGRFTDRSNADVLPALCVALVFAVLFVAGSARRALASREPPDWVRTCADGIAGTSVLRLLPVTFVLQIGTLFGMETFEQIVVYGHVLGGTLWLGGPLAVSLLMHAAAGALVIALFARLLRGLARAVVDVIRFVRRLAVAWPHDAPAVCARTCTVPLRRSDERAFDRLKGRAPPHLIRS